MSGLSRYCVNYKKYVFILATTLVIFVGLSHQFAWSHIGLPKIDSRTLAVLARQHPVVVLFRHAERCDRSDNPCLSDKSGITVHGAQQARALGASFGKDVAEYSLYASDTVRTIQSATWFSSHQKLTVDKNMHACGRGTEHAIEQILGQSPDKNVVIFTHNHCLTYLAKNMRGVKFEPNYLDGLVMHAEKGKLFLDGQFVSP